MPPLIKMWVETFSGVCVSFAVDEERVATLCSLLLLAEPASVGFNGLLVVAASSLNTSHL